MSRASAVEGCWEFDLDFSLFPSALKVNLMTGHAIAALKNHEVKGAGRRNGHLERGHSLKLITHKHLGIRGDARNDQPALAFHFSEFESRERLLIEGAGLIAGVDE